MDRLAVAALVAGGVSAALIAADILFFRRQKTAVMNFVWPITGLYAGPIGLFLYSRLGRRRSERPFWQSVCVSTLHCGAGCSCGDLVAEWFVFFVPVAILGHRIFGSWVLDYFLALAFGVAFQYFAIRPVRDLPVGAAIREAFKADVLSLSAWQIGMYGWMALVTFVFYKRELPHDGPLFWFQMQIAMLAGFVTAYPVNWWLVGSGVKEAMGSASSRDGGHSQRTWTR